MSKTSKLIAAIDMGSNSYHLTIAEETSEANLKIIDEHKEEVRVAELVDSNGYLTQEAFEQSAKSLLRMKEISSSWNAAVRAVGTHSIRMAKNHTEFCNYLKSKTGITVEIIDGLEEARLSLLGIRLGLPIEKTQVLGIDIGGGSTEAVIACGESILYARSLSIGAVNLNTRFFKENKPKRKEIESMKLWLNSRFVPLEQEARSFNFTKAIGASGSIRAIARCIHYMNNGTNLDNLHGQSFSTHDLNDFLKILTKLKEPKKIMQSFPLERKRAEIILSGTCILAAVSDLFAVEEWQASSWGLRQGLILDTISRLVSATSAQSPYHEVRLKTINDLSTKFGVSAKYNQQVSAFSQNIFEQLEKRCPKTSRISKTESLEVLFAAANLSEIGKKINYRNFHKHSAYLITHSDLMGYSMYEKELIAAVTLYSRKKLMKPDSSDLPCKLVNFLTGCLRIAKAANRSRKNEILSVNCFYNSEKIIFEFVMKSEEVPAAEQYSLEKEHKYLCKAFETDIEYRYTS